MTTKISYKNWTWLGIGMMLACCAVLSYAYDCKDPAANTYSPAVENYNYSLGTQTIGPAYQFTGETRLVETSKEILAMGSNILKVSLELSSYDLPNTPVNFSHELFDVDASFREILSMDFKYYLFWVYAPKAGTHFLNGLSAQEAQDERENIYKLAEYLLQHCAGSGKEFYIGHWEGDWHLLTNYNGGQQTVDAARIQGMIDWYNVRQRAIEDAKAANTGSDVKVYQYCEVNRVYDAINNGYDRIVNKVLPHIDVDFVSYSSYDATGNSNYANLEREMHGALNYIEQNMKPKPGIAGKRVFIGEYGYASRNIGAREQDRRMQMVMKAALKWACPFVLYWEMYNNEVDAQGNHNGFWLINNKGIRQPAHYTHSKFYADMKAWVNEYYEGHGHRLPSREEYFAHAVSFFE
jgi:hypothetical protein